MSSRPSRLLWPIALAQGLWVRQTVPRLPPAPGDRGAFGNGPRTSSVVGVGDSIVAGVGVERQEQSLLGHFSRRLHERTRRPVRWRACGLNGADCATIRDQVAPRAPAADVYVTSAGVNDAVRGTSIGRFSDHLAGLIEMLRARSPHAQIIFAGIPPLDRFPALPWPLGALLGARAAGLQAAARRVAGDLGATCFDFPPELPPGGFARDGFHPAADACDAWAGWLIDAWLSSPDRPSAGCGSASPPA